MKVDIISGFLGAGKTTFINTYLPLLEGRLALIENEFGDTSIDSALIEDDIPMKEIFAGCICCTLRGDFASGIKEIYDAYHPDRIVVEPSGIGRLSDVVKGIEDAGKMTDIDLSINRLIVLVDSDTFEDFSEEFGPFYLDQIQNANVLILTHMEEMTDEDMERISKKIKEINPGASLLAADYRDMDRGSLMEVIESSAKGLVTQGESTRAIPGDKVFSSFSIEAADLNEDGLRKAFEKLETKDYGYVLRAKGYIENGTKLFQYTPGKIEISPGANKGLEKLVVIGTDLDEGEIRKLLNH